VTAVTEEEWLECTNPIPMLTSLFGKVPERKLRLFACGVYRSFWSLLQKSDRHLIKLAELHADGVIGGRKLVRASLSAGWGRTANAPHIRSVSWLSDVRETALTAASVIADENAGTDSRLRASILRCVFGNPFRLVAAHRLSWATWRNSTVIGLAGYAYHERSMDHLPVLADALEDVGCTDAGVLDHLRGPGPHVRGCWVLDHLLNRT
jgi:hypothetical protein